MAGMTNFEFAIRTMDTVVTQKEKDEDSANLALLSLALMASPMALTILIVSAGMKPSEPIAWGPMVSLTLLSLYGASERFLSLYERWHYGKLLRKVGEKKIVVAERTTEAEVDRIRTESHRVIEARAEQLLLEHPWYFNKDPLEWEKEVNQEDADWFLRYIYSGNDWSRYQMVEKNFIRLPSSGNLLNRKRYEAFIGFFKWLGIIEGREQGTKGELSLTYGQADDKVRQFFRD